MAPRYTDRRAVGGAETLIRKLAEQAAQRGHQVDFLTTCAVDHATWKNVRPPGTARHNGLKVHYFLVDESRDAALFLQLQEQIVRRGGISPAAEEAWYRNNLHSPDLYSYLDAQAAELDFIIAGPYLFGLSLELARRHPDRLLLIPCLHDEPFARLTPVRQMFLQVRGCLFNSPPEKDLARRLYALPEDRCAVVGMGLDPLPRDPGRFSARHHIRQPYLIYSGRREPLKGTPLLVEYLRVFRQRQGIDLALVLTGSGEIPLSEDSRSWVYDCGVLSEEEKYQALAGGFAFCHPSALESFGIVILEAWLASIPVLVNARSEVLRYHCQQSGGGLWFRNYGEFEEEILLLWHNPELRQAMARQGREYVLREYSWDVVNQRFETALVRFSAAGATSGSR